MELDRDEMRMRLACREPDEEVGVPGNPYDCLISRDLAGVTGETWVVMPRADHVGGPPYYRLLGDPETTFPLPKWANRLALAFDSLADDQAELKAVTAKQAIALFDEVSE